MSTQQSLSAPSLAFTDDEAVIIDPGSIDDIVSRILQSRARSEAEDTRFKLM
jgi:hypothetical protein